MIKSFYKYTVFFIIFLLVFNFNSISYAKTEVYRLENQSLQSLGVKVDFEKVPLEKINRIDIGEVLASMLLSDLLFIPGGILTYVLIVVTYLIAGTFLQGYSQEELKAIAPIILILSFSLLNSLIVYSFGKDKKNHSYLITILGSIAGTILFILLNNLAIVAESVFTDHEKSSLASYAWILNILLIPLFATVGATIAYNLSENKQEVLKESTDIESLITEYNTNYKSLVENINISRGNLSYSIVRF